MKKAVENGLELNQFEIVKTVWDNPHIEAESIEYYIIRNNNKCGLWNNTIKKLILPCHYISIEPVQARNNLHIWLFLIGSGAIDDFSIEPQERGVFNAIDEVFIVETNGNYVTPIFGKKDSLYEYVMGFIVHSLSKDKVGIINIEGDVICPIVFDRHNDWGNPPRKKYYDSILQGPYRQEIVLSYEEIDSSGYNHGTVFYFALSKGNQYYLYNGDGKQITDIGYKRIELVYSRLHQFSHMGTKWDKREVYFKVTTDNGIGLLSHDNTMILDCKYEALEYLPSMDVVVAKEHDAYQIFNMNYHREE